MAIEQSLASDRATGPTGDPTADPAMDQVVASLRAAFPSVSESHVRECVARIHATLDGARVRAYVPILVAREARDELAARSRTLRLAPDPGT